MVLDGLQHQVVKQGIIQTLNEHMIFFQINAVNLTSCHHHIGMDHELLYDWYTYLVYVRASGFDLSKYNDCLIILLNNFLMATKCHER